MTDQLTPQEKQKLAEWLKKKVPGGVPLCPVCGSRQWSMADHLIAPPTGRGHGLIIGGTAYPMAMLICTVCANTLLFNAVLTGLVTSQPASTDDKPGSSDG